MNGGNRIAEIKAGLRVIGWMAESAWAAHLSGD
jgi:hypothetical protein